MPDTPIAYHITFGTYGMRLYGDERGTVDRLHNQFLEPLLSEDVVREGAERSLLKFLPNQLSEDQRAFIESWIPTLCQRGGWKLNMSAAQPDHVHVCLTGAADGKVIRKWLKRWLGEALSVKWEIAVGQSWWAEGAA